MIAVEGSDICTLRLAFFRAKEVVYFCIVDLMDLIKSVIRFFSDTAEVRTFCRTLAANVIPVNEGRKVEVVMFLGEVGDIREDVVPSGTPVQH